MTTEWWKRQLAEDNTPDHTLTERDGYRRCVVACTKCSHMWVRCIRIGIDRGDWLCPRGWRKKHGCAGGHYVVIDAPHVEAAWRLTDRYGFGDMDGHPP